MIGLGWTGVAMALCPCVEVEADGALDKRLFLSASVC